MGTQLSNEGTTSDTISRQAAIELCDWYEHEFFECDYAIRALADDLKSLPIAETERMRGKWAEKSHPQGRSRRGNRRMAKL